MNAVGPVCAPNGDENPEPASNDFAIASTSTPRGQSTTAGFASQKASRAITKRINSATHVISIALRKCESEFSRSNGGAATASILERKTILASLQLQQPFI